MTNTHHTHTHVSSFKEVLSMLKGLLTMLLSVTPMTAMAATVNVTDNDILAGQTVNWTSDNTYILDGFVFVDDGAILNIEAGTVIKGKSGQGEDASALIIARGGKIFAQGTAQSPIIFTGEADDVTRIDDIDPLSTKLWGGLIILGKATNNAPGGEGHVEGIPETEPRGAWGGDDDEDNSGVLRYVSIRHGGSIIGANNEINGLSLGAVGSGTTIEYVEVFSNADDGFEFFGGTVQAKYLASIFNQDDSFDTDEGFRGKGQFWFALQSDQPELADCLTEQDGGTSPEDALPWSQPILYNLTLIGCGKTGPTTSSQLGMNLRDNTAGTWANSIIMAHSGQAISIETPSSGVGSIDRLNAGDLKLLNNIWYDFGAGDTFETIAKQDYTAAHLAANANTINNPMLRGISYIADGGLDPRPATGSPVYTGLSPIPNDDFFTQVNYKGAFGADNWLEGWSALYTYGFMSESSPTVVEDEETAAPEEVALLVNYPNPFNPVTSIAFNLAASGQVSLTVFDALGQKVDTLIDNAVMTPGVHSVQWNAAVHASGVYFYRLETGSTILTSKMLLMK